MDSATGFGIARASSLGLVTSDLSCMLSAPFLVLDFTSSSVEHVTNRSVHPGVYARTAIYSNAELYLGIIAANAALSRQIYVFFFGEKEQKTNNSSYAQHSQPSRSAYLNSRLRGDHAARPETYIHTDRRLSNAKSDNSDIPLEPGIQKRTDFWISEEDVDSDGQTGTNAKKM